MPKEHIGNWGKWGPDDEKGTLNYITPDAIKQAATLVRRGKVYSLATPLRRRAPIWPTRNKTIHVTLYENDPSPGGTGAAEDMLIMHTHGTTHIDALAHSWYDSRLYNGWPASVVDSGGAKRNGIDNVKGLVSRGLLLDITGFKGEDILQKDYIITPKDLEDCLSWEGAGIRSGDVVLIRTGWINMYWKDRAEFESGEPGLGLAAADWFMEKEVTALGADNNALEVVPPETPSLVMPLHRKTIRDHGCYIIELLQLDELARDKVYEFLFIAAPLQIRKGLGSPLNPLAIA